ncbi:MAG: hypothetical protein FAZ92_02927 [Accumulibacter sp.]|nr:MAG: hypothetical protein FAZ92_02927 [Accumulibacter sp.]
MAGVCAPGAELDRLACREAAASGEPLPADRHAVAAMADLEQVIVAIAVEVGSEPGDIGEPAVPADEARAVGMPDGDLRLAIGFVPGADEVCPPIAVVVVQAPVDGIAGDA